MLKIIRILKTLFKEFNRFLSFFVKKKINFFSQHIMIESPKREKET